MQPENQKQPEPYSPEVAPVVTNPVEVQPVTEIPPNINSDTIKKPIVAEIKLDEIPEVVISGPQVVQISDVPVKNHQDKPPKTEQEEGMSRKSENPVPEKNRRHKKWGSLLTSTVLITIFTVVFVNRQYIIDSWSLRDYQPPEKIVQLASSTKMTDEARRIFYVSNPQVQDKQEFYTNCDSGETTVVLGCYRHNTGIYLLKVDDPRLSGVEEVTVAHELLHAAYERLGLKEQRKLSQLLQNEYKRINDTSINEKIKLYEEVGADIAYELHSILGTEAPQLSEELEAHYRKYFNDRQVIVALSAQYQLEFSSRKAKLLDLDANLSSLENQVNDNNKILSEMYASIKEEGDALDKLLREGKIDEYNAGVSNYNSSITPYQVLLGQTRDLVESYKSTLEERNKIALEAQELSKAIDSNLKTSSPDITN